MTNKKVERSGLTTRYTAEEKARLSYLAKIFGVDVSNVPRTLLWNHFGISAEVQEGFNSFVNEEAKETLPFLNLSHDTEKNLQANRALQEHCTTVKEALDVLHTVATDVAQQGANFVPYQDEAGEISEVLEPMSEEQFARYFADDLIKYLENRDSDIESMLDHHRDELMYELKSCNLKSLAKSHL